MIRFVRIGDQINGEFGFFETMEDGLIEFIEFNGTHTWNDWMSFNMDFNEEYPYSGSTVHERFMRFKGLHDAEIAQSRAQDSNPEDLGSKPVSAPQMTKISRSEAIRISNETLINAEKEREAEQYVDMWGEGSTFQGYKEGYRRGYYKGYEIGKEHQKEKQNEENV